MNKPKHPPETIIAALERTGGTKSAAARRLRISRPTLDRYILQFDEVRLAYSRIRAAAQRA